MGINIPYESEGFPAGTIPNGPNTLDTTWGEILLAAITVGRPDLYHVFRANAPVVSLSKTALRVFHYFTGTTGHCFVGRLSGWLWSSAVPDHPSYTRPSL